MLLLADHWGIEIAEVRKESHSSKESGTRPIYNRLIKDIQLGYFNGIVTWAPDRLSRNAGDLGILVDLMDQGKLAEIGGLFQWIVVLLGHLLVAWNVRKDDAAG